MEGEQVKGTQKCLKMRRQGTYGKSIDDINIMGPNQYSHGVTREHLWELGIGIGCDLAST